MCATALITVAASAMAVEGDKGERVPAWAIGKGEIQTMEEMAA